MRIHHERLRKRGWSDEEIEHAHGVIRRADERKHPAHAFLEVAVFWGLILVTIVATFLISIGILPLLMILPPWLVALLLAILGLCVGALFALLIKDIEWIEGRHHVFNIIILTVIAFLNLWLIMRKLEAYLPEQEPLLLFSALFAASLLAPYLFHILTEGRR